MKIIKMKKMVLSLLLMGVLYGNVQVSYADSSGPNSPGTIVDDATIGTTSWDNPDNARTANGVFATSLGMPTHYLKATDFGFAIPASSTINGILVDVKKRAGGSPLIKDNSVKIVKGGNISDSQRKSADWWPITLTYVSYGSSTDLWGETWTAENINDPNFGFVISAAAPEGGKTPIYIDHIQITVYYTEEKPIIDSNSTDSILREPNQVFLHSYYKRLDFADVNMANTFYEKYIIRIGLVEKTFTPVEFFTLLGFDMDEE